ncbi:hypothetical protein ACFX13_004258 [Malus domestica]|uniref:RNase H type-1 domain-containing protein n=1 Tax=Malus domestica TaxID=3750 RepID=A0A498ISV8_MALDO|nr:uncharacterized protein LOC103445735 [Malus domestica]RXH86518.1 hypothetical protein DVH24_021791 [Malus domestica]
MLEHQYTKMRVTATITRNVIWNPPISIFVKINVDGAWKPSGNAGLGVVIRDCRGMLLGRKHCHILKSSIEEIEAEAALVGLVLANDMGLENIMVESDSKVFVDSVKKKSIRSMWRIYPIMEEIWRLFSSFTQVRWKQIHRETNKAAHEAASYSIDRVCSQQWATQPYPSLVLILSKDGLPCPPRNVNQC